MTLRKQLFLAICLFLLVAFSGSFFPASKAPASKRSVSCVPTPRTRPPRWGCR